MSGLKFQRQIKDDGMLYVGVKLNPSATIQKPSAFEVGWKLIVNGINENVVNPVADLYMAGCWVFKYQQFRH